MLQEVWRESLWSARPMTVVEDFPHRTVLWKPHGTVFQLPWPLPGHPRQPRAERIAGCMERGDYVFEPAMWEVSTLWFLYPDTHYSIWYSWYPDGQPWGWYVNFQRPFDRAGADRLHTMDLALDLVVDLDLNWHWKDRDEFDLRSERGLTTIAEAAAVKEAADKVRRRLVLGKEPFDEPWGAWLPDPEWPPPELPPDWRSLT